MTVQMKSKYRVDCVKCKRTIQRSEPRLVDGTGHRHFTCYERSSDAGFKAWLKRTLKWMGL